jgi:NADH dehydrogenase
MAKEVLIVGAGFGGLQAARTLSSDSSVNVTVLDQRNHHLFQPLLYQVATAGLNPADIAAPVRAQFTHARNVDVHLGRVTAVDLANKRVSLAEGLTFAWDYLILACGAQHSYFGHPEWESFAPGLKTLEQATEIRRRILFAFESAENEAHPAVQRPLLTFVVVGGGATGVELAGAIADISRTVLVRDFRHIDPTTAHVLLLEAGPRILPAFAEELSSRAEKDLRALGVEVRTSAAVTRIDSDGVEIGGKQHIAAKSVFWAAGVQAATLGRTLGVELDRAGRVIVNADLSIPGYRDVFVIGDMAHFVEPGGELVPGLAPAAIQEGRAAARNILASMKGRPRKAFRYLDKGMMATIGKHKAIAQTGRFRMTGFIAWVAWLFIHILYLIGFKNRVSVFVQWIWSYMFSKRGARLITQRDWKLPP